MAVESPIIKMIPDVKNELEKFSQSLEEGTKEEELIRNYPTVYIHNWRKNDKFEVYVGESNDFFQRTHQHYDEINNDNVWQSNLKNNNANLFVIAHPEFNKSLTLDIENKLIKYLSSSSNISKVHNARGNPQNKYFTSEDFDEIFTKIWNKLRKYNKDFDKDLFLLESQIKDSIIYKASPLHKLNFEQQKAKDLIMDIISENIIKDGKCQFIFVKGKAGTGKTVLLSSLFYEMINQFEINVYEDSKKTRKLDCAIVVNHPEQLTVYDEITKKLDLCDEKDTIVFNPTQFINLFKNKKRKNIYDVVFIDEAHLLWTQNNQAFTDNKQLDAIMKYAKVVVAMFDDKQIMNAQQYLSNEEINKYITMAKENHSYIELTKQMRMHVNEEVINWINNICNEGKLTKLTKNRDGYDIKIFDSPKELEYAIKEKASKEDTALSRIIASYDWPYSGVSSPENEKYWSVKIDDWVKPWNKELMRYETRKIEKKKNKSLAWAEQPQTINEVGSIYTIQGFDLNYAGVIIGPSVKFRDNKIIFDPSASCNDRATHKRSLEDGTKKSFAEKFIKNELNVLLTRGVNGLYIYTCDEELRIQLKKSIK